MSIDFTEKTIRKATDAEIPFDLYKIEKSFLDHLKKTEPNIPDSDYCEFFVGPVFTDANNISFFAPIALKPELPEETVLVRQANGILGALNFNRMIPCLAKNLISLEKYTDEALRHRNFCLGSKTIIEGCAEATYLRQVKAHLGQDIKGFSDG